MKQTIYLSDGKIYSTSSPASVLWGQIKSDQFTHHFDFNVRQNNRIKNGKGTPCVFNTGKKGSSVNKYDALSINPISFSKDWQIFAADAMSYQVFGVKFTELTGTEKDYIAGKFTGLYGDGKAYCNTQGFNNDADPRANYVKNQDLQYEPPKMFALVDGTNSFQCQVIDDDYILLYSFIENSPPTNYGIEILNDPRMGWCTNIYPGGDVGPFPQFKEYNFLDVPRPFVTKEPVYYWLDEVWIYTGEKRKLYYP